VRRGLILAVAMGVFAAGVRADQITLKNGDRLTGTIVKSDDKTLLIKTELAGDVNVQWAAVTAIVSSQNLHLGLKDGQTVVGTVTTNDGKFDVTTKTAGNVEAPKDAVVTVRSDAEQQAYDAEIGHDGRGHERADTQCATNLRIDARIVFHVLAGDKESSANAFSGETLLYVHRSS